MPFSGVANLTDAQRRSTKPSITIPHHPHHHESQAPPKSKSKSKSSNITPAVPFIQQMQLLQVLEGGKLEDHIRRHHKHFGEGALEETRDRNFKDDKFNNKDLKNAGGYTITDERGMMWFDEEEQWEFKELLPKEDEVAPATVPVTPKPTGLRKLFGASKKSTQALTGWETFDQSGRVDYEETDDDNGGLSPGVTGKLGFAYPPEYNTVFDKKVRRTATSFQCGYVPPSGALKLPPPPPPPSSNTSRRKQPVVTHNAPKVIPPSPSIPSSKTAIATMSHNQLKKEFLAEAFTPVSLPATRSHTPASNSQTSLLLPPASRSQTSLPISSSSHSSSRSISSPFARLRSQKAGISGTKV